ncbi:unnamed protein product [Rotaria sp. Silwood2]|nr:unnamed protein product [Rotaria sp. Silwood2]CAF3006131.1 unnamed protein product [Rotaria sp. Silwood2]
MKFTRSKFSPSSTETQQKSNNKQYDSILYKLDLINRRLNDFDRRMDDFNYRLKLLEKSSINKQQRRDLMYEQTNKRITHFNDDPRF